jgi:xanthine dehydrogenase accessory factor
MMQTLDREVLEHLSQWLAAGQQPWLCTIVKTTGSSPRPVGSLVAISEDGLQVGSVSGGCVEEELLEKIRNGLYPGRIPQLLEYGVSAEENERLGLPCGGRIQLLLQRLLDEDKHWVDELLQALSKRQCVVRTLELADATTSLTPVPHFRSLALSGETLRHCFGPRMRMLLVGAGELARRLAELGQAMDYEIVVTDPRAAKIAQWEGPEVQLIQGMPDDVIRQHASDRHCVIITLTHDPRIDDMALMEALETEAWYVGALGSRRTTEKRLRRLRQLDIAENQVARLQAPVGLDIGSKTPIEIAISIMAQLTLLRSQAGSARPAGR